MEDIESLEPKITKLPSEILLKIISQIPLKEAVRTSILSTSWKSLLAPIQVKFDDFDGKKIMGFLLKPCESTPEILKVSLHVDERENDLVFQAVKGGEKDLYLDFSLNKQKKCNFNLVLEPNCSIPCDFNFSSIKTLNLISVNRLTKDLVSSLFFNCQVLETLKLEKCVGLKNVSVKASNFLTSFEMVDCPNLESIMLSAPNLKSFSYRGVLPLIQIKGSLRLVDSVLDLRDGFENKEFDCEDVMNLLEAFKEIESLRISGWLLEWMCAAGVMFGRLPFKFSKLKELCWFDSLMDQTKRDSLACFLNMTPSLEKLFIKIDQDLTPIICPYFHQHYHEPILWMDYETVKSNASQLDHLKMVEFKGFTSQEDELVLLDLLLNSATPCTLKSMVVISREEQPRQVAKIPRSQLKHTSCGKRRTVVSAPNKDYFFGLTQENNSAIQCL
ncbi:F-box protein [Actinidia chinensis var. chinensis]|uniref:F-box protein n=1 Tax=Actinidia chinensis var. chinensis TaxID=1590841 RepID=A0A2R6R863_ACTCC|nr:F-box protein [Actinidia chinensis var. chinensis]